MGWGARGASNRDRQLGVFGHVEHAGILERAVEDVKHDAGRSVGVCGPPRDMWTRV